MAVSGTASSPPAICTSKVPPPRSFSRTARVRPPVPFDKAQCADVLRRDEDIAGTRIECRSAPVRAAQSSRENERHRRRRSSLSIFPRRERAGIFDAAALLDELPAGGGMFRLSCLRAVTRSSCAVGHARERRRLHRNRLRRKRRLARDIAFGHRALFDAKDRLAVFTIQDVHVTGLGGQRHALESCVRFARRRTARAARAGRRPRDRDGSSGSAIWYVPVRMSTATTELPYRLAPFRSPP